MNRHVARAFCAIALTPLLARGQSVPGYTMAMKVSIDSGTGTMPASTIKMEAAGDKLRMSFGAGSSLPIGDMYIVYDGGAGTMTTVMPTMRQATVMRMGDQSFGMMSMMLKMALKGEPVIEVDDRGAGDPILGHATHRYRLHVTYTMTITMGDASCERAVTQDDDVWTSRDAGFSDGLHKAMREAMGGGSMSLAGAKLVTAMREKLPGLWMRSVGTTTTRFSAGGAQTVKGTSEMTEFSTAPIDPARLAPPADFRVLDLAAMMADIDPEMMAGAMAAGAGDAAKKVLCGGRP